LNQESNVVALQHFTGYEADGEIQLNFAQARYQSAAQGRFTSPDPLGASMAMGNPQSFNRYSYVVNNPVNLVDPSGLVNSHGDSRYPWEEDPFGDIPWTDGTKNDYQPYAGDGIVDRNAGETPADAGIEAPQNPETGADLAQRATTGLIKHPGLLDEIQANTASGVDVHIVACQAAKESNYASLSQISIPRKNAGAYISDAGPGPDGEIGLLQIKPSTAGVSAQALKSVGTNVKAATSYLMGIKKHFNVGMREALAIYNWGPGNFNKVGQDVTRIFSGSLSYADKILDCSRRLYLPSDRNPYKFLPR